MAPAKKYRNKDEKCDTKSKKHQRKNVGIHKEKRIHFRYTEEALAQAIEAIRSKNKGIREACRQYGVPRATVQDRISGRILEKPRKVGPEPLLGFDGEQKVVDWIINLAKCGIPVNKDLLLDTVKEILKDMGKADKLPEGKRPGQTWYQSFLRRHPEISVREPESINKARESVKESTIRKWFEELECFLTEKGLINIMENPERILNADETGVSLCPKTGKVLAPKGYKNVYIVKKGNEKETLTVLVTMTASGKICPPLVVFPYVRPPKAVIDNMPDGWVIGKTESGWMRSDVFYEYIANDFNDWLTANNVKRPVILFVDGHRSHMSMQLSTFCEDNDIILYALPPNTTHITQPADVSVFRPLKMEWKKTVSNWQSRPENHNSTVTKTNFCKVFQEVLNKDMTVTIKNGFKKCGLYPFNVEAVDFTKCVKDYQERRTKQYSSDDLTERDFFSAQKVIMSIKNNLINLGIDANVVCNQIESARNNCKEKRRSTSKTPRKSTEVTKRPSLKTPEQTNITKITATDTVTTGTGTVQVQVVDSRYSNNMANSSCISIDDISIPDVGSFVSLTDISVLSIKDLNLESINLTDTSKDCTEPLIIENIAKLVASEEKDLKFIEKADPFEKHLKFIEKADTKTKKKNFPKYPSAISAKQWRNYYELKETEKRNDEVQKTKRKAEREQKKNEKALKKQKIVEQKQIKAKQTKKLSKTDKDDNKANEGTDKTKLEDKVMKDKENIEERKIIAEKQEAELYTEDANKNTLTEEYKKKTKNVKLNDKTNCDQTNEKNSLNEKMTELDLDIVESEEKNMDNEEEFSIF